VGKTLVTGADGHLGANLVRELLAREEDVRALILSPGNRALDGLPVERFFGDVRDPASMRAAVVGCDQIHHCAAKISTVRGGERDLYDCNVTGTRNVLAAAQAAGVERVVVSGSLGAIGHTPDRPTDETVPFDPFGTHMPSEHTKMLVEFEALRAACDGLNVLVAISCAILGPNDYVPSRMGATLINFAHRRIRAYIPGGFEFVTTRDIVAGHLLTMEKGRPGQKYIFGSGYRSMDELMATYEDVCGVRRPRLRLRPGLMYGIGAVASPIITKVTPHRQQLLTPDAVRLLTMQRKADCTKARNELGFQPTSIDDAIREAYDDFVRRGLIESRTSA
jgi:nucleoside-diphosphate-sugar epimerase